MPSYISIAAFNEVNTDTLINYTTQNPGMGSNLIDTPAPALSSVTEWDRSSSLSRFRVSDNVTIFLMVFIQFQITIEGCTAGN